MPVHRNEWSLHVDGSSYCQADTVRIRQITLAQLSLTLAPQDELHRPVGRVLDVSAKWRRVLASKAWVTLREGTKDTE